jgi:exosome complex component RRP41
MGGNNGMQLIINGKRLDGRAVDELREIKMFAGILNKADGSGYIEWGRNKVLAAVYGPREVVPKHETDPYRAVVRARYLMAPFSTLEEHGRGGPNRRSIEISKVVREVFENVIISENYPKTAIDIFIEILEGHGSTRCVGINAASLALATAGIPLRDIPVAVSVGKIDGTIAVDMAKEEDNFGESDVAVAIAPNSGDILLLQMDGKLTREEVSRAFDLIYNAAKEISAKQIAALKALYSAQKENIEEREEENKEENISSFSDVPLSSEISQSQLQPASQTTSEDMGEMPNEPNA